MAKFDFFRRSGVLKLVLSTLVLVFLTINVFATTYDWVGGTNTNTNNANNWYNETTFALNSGVPGPTDNAYIGVNTSYTTFVLIVPTTHPITLTAANMPVVNANTTWGSLIFGYYGPTSSYTYGVKENLSLSVSSGFTLTVNGNVTQNHYASAQGSTFNYIATTILGSGNMLCKGNFVVGDATQPGTQVAIVTQVKIQITQLTINGNILLNSTGNAVTGANGGICYPWFSVEKGTTTLLKQITFAATNGPIASAFSARNGNAPGYQGYGEFTADNTASSPSTVELQYLQPIVPADQFYVYFTYGGNNGTVLYDDPTVENQTIYTANEPSVTTTSTYINTTSPAYYNLTFSGASTKLVDKNSALTGAPTQGLTVGSTWTTGGGAVNLNTNNPTVTVTGAWINAATVTQGAGNILIGSALTNNSGGALNLGAGNLSIAGNYTNNVGGTYTQGTGTTFFNGTGPQALVDNSTTGTTFKKVNFSGSGTATMSAGTNNVNFSVATTGILTMSNTAKLVAGTTVAAGGASYLTLNSDANSSASVDKITTTAPISGNVNVQRFLNGGSTYNAGRWVYRNYRLMSSPVNAGKVGVNYPYTINYLAAGAIVTGAKSTFSTIGGNPTIYLYSEDYTPSNATFTSGNFKGVSDISNLASPYTLAITDNGTSKALYVGNGFMFFFRGDNIHSVGTNPGKTTSPFVAPESVVFTATGFLNQNSYTVNNWYNGSNLLYTTVTTPAPGNAAVKGYNLVGNPYACAIDWNTVNTGGITATNVNPSIYVFNPVNNQYNTYSSSSHLGNPGTFTGLIASGQGFYVQANNSNPLATPALVFNETAKSPATQPTGTNLLMGTPAGQIAVQQLFRLKLRIDSLNYDDIVIGFNSSASPKFNGMEDAQYLAGPGAPEGLSSLSSDSVRLAINFLPLPKQTPQVIRLDVEATNSGLLTLQKTQLDAIPQIYEIWLMDKYKKDSLDIRNNANYAFNINKSDTASFGKNRFEIVIRQNPALGIHLLNFTAAKAANGAQTTWKVENEENYTNFTLERSTDNGVTFNVLGGQLSNAQGTYSYLDNNPAKAVDLYRLKIEDMNGTITYSKVIALVYSNPGNSLANNNINVYPNPASGVINLSIAQNNVPTNLSGYQLSSIPALASSGSDAGSQSYNIKIINITGSVVKTAISSQPEWHGNVYNLPPGTYIVQVLNNSDKTLVGKTTFIKL